MKGIDAAYFVWPVQTGLVHATVNFAQAAKETGVELIISLLSQRSANRKSTSNSCRDSFIAEQVFNWSGLAVIHLRPPYFLEWLLYPWQLPYLQKGVLRMQVGKGRHSPTAADDQGRVIAALLKRPNEYIGTTIPISGGRDGSRADGSRAVRSASPQDQVSGPSGGRKICASLAEMGVPAYIVQHLSGAMLDYQRGHMSGADNNVEKLTGRRSMTVAGVRSPTRRFSTENRGGNPGPAGSRSHVSRQSLSPHNL